MTREGLRWARDRHRGVFLFANGGAIPYYERCGFTPLAEFVEFADVRPTLRREGAIRLDPGAPGVSDRIFEYARRRAPVSDRFWVGNPRLLMFHALYTLREHLYEIPDLDCLVLCAHEDGCLRLYDVVGERVPSLDELYPYIADPQDRTLEVHFHADKLGVEGLQPWPLEDNNPFTFGRFPVKDVVFPYTSRA
mgnify:CR=1 FL=1